jgi:predicted signal transduction protein with EAL and GGDEF domain
MTPTATPWATRCSPRWPRPAASRFGPTTSWAVTAAMSSSSSQGITPLRATQIAGQLARPTPRVLGRDGKPLTYSASIGIAECMPGCDLPTLLTRADQAMYEAKRAGGGNWRVFRDTMGATQTARQPALCPNPA